MPELPEVQTVVDHLAPRLAGQRITAAELLRPDIVSQGRIQRNRPGAVATPGHFPTCLVGVRVASVTRRAKRIVFTLDDATTFYVHLGMTGNLTLTPHTSPLPTHTHLRLSLETAGELRFTDPRRFGRVVHTPTDDDTLGPEPLTLRTPQLLRRLATTARPLKSALLDQRLVAGLGNIYVDEALFAAHLHPLTPTNTLTPADAARLNRAIKLVLRRAIRARGSTLRDYRDPDGTPGTAQLRHHVYARTDQPCRACRTPIARIVIGQRSTHFCPHCQKV